MKERPLSATMAIAIGEALDHGGKLIRLAGGFWTAPGTPRRPHDGVPEWYVTASTLQALERRGLATYTERKKGRDFTFPIAADVRAPSPLSPTPNTVERTG